MKENNDWKEIAKKIGILCIISIFLSVGIATFFTGHLWDINNVKNNLENLRIWTTFNRVFIMFFGLVYIGMHFIISIKKMYIWMFEKRWILAIVLLLFMTINRYHGDSIGTYNYIVQPECVNEQSWPIFGETRTIRSDEFVVTTPAILASSYGENAYGKYNDIMRGNDTLNIINGVFVGFATLGYAPQELTYAVLPVEYAFSFCWWFPVIFTFLMTMELFYIITKKNKLLSVVGAVLIVFSSYYLWWGFPIQLLAAPGTVVCVYYFLQNKEWWKKILYGLGTAICFSMFVTNLYPAWQVPLGYMFLAIGIWLLHENWDKVKNLKKSDWVILGCSVLFMVSLIISYLYSISEYREIITQTAYPGERVDTGSFYIQKLFYYAQSPFYSYKDIGNPSEAGVYFSLFPIPTIMAAYCWLREKKKDWLTGCLLLVQIPMLIYVTVGFPEIIAKVLLLSYSTVARLSDVIGLLQIYFIIIVMSRYDKVKKMPLLVAIPLGGLTAFASVYFSNQSYPDYMAIYQKIIMFIVILGLCVGIMVGLKERAKKLLLFAFIGISFFTSIYIRPLMKGMDAIYSKPVAREIQRICEEDPEAKWMTEGIEFYLSGFSVACGASTVNSVNTYPNFELWKKLDPTSQYDEIYNRYAHVSIEFVDDETSFELLYPDHMEVNLSYKDIEKTEAEYLLVVGELNVNEENSYVKFEKIYEEGNASIYHMIY